MIEIKKLVEMIEEIADPGLAEDWDNCGMQIDLGHKTVEKVLVTLEVTNDIVGEAQKENADFIISHHPLFFNPIRSVNRHTVMGDHVIRLILAGISVYSAHTSFDKAQGGNNAYMAELIGLSGIRRFNDPAGNNFDNIMGRKGEFSTAITLEEACKKVEKALSLPVKYIKAVGDLSRMVRTVGLCTGAGSGLIDIALANGCDLFITGDVKYHEAQKSREAGLCLIDAGHYGTEHIFAENFAQRLRKKTEGQVEIIESNLNINPFSIE